MPQIDQAGLDLIKSFESCSLTAYWDKIGQVWTIGWGHTGGVTSGQVITQAQADAFLQADLASAQNVVNNCITRNCTPNQYAAFVSFEYNTGALAASSAMRLFNAGDPATAADHLLLYNKGMIGGTLQVVPGLVRRREAEKALFLTP